MCGIIGEISHKASQNGCKHCNSYEDKIIGSSFSREKLLLVIIVYQLIYRPMNQQCFLCSNYVIIFNGNYNYKI